MTEADFLLIRRLQVTEHQAWLALVSELRKAGVGDINPGGRHERLASAIAAWGEELAQLRINDPDPSHAERALEERRRRYLDGDDYEDRR
jgi:hypothetical protein